MDIQNFLGVNYCDLFDPSEGNFDLQDSWNNDWLENIFSSSSSSSSSDFSSSPPSSSSSASPQMMGMDDLLPASNSPDSVQHEHSYSLGSGNSSPSLDSWTSAVDKDDPFDILKDIDTSFDFTANILDERDDPAILDCLMPLGDNEPMVDQWMEASSSTSSPSFPPPSPDVDDESLVVTSPVGRKSIVLFTGEDGQTIKFTSEKPTVNEELILIDWTYDEQTKDPIDLSVRSTKPASSTGDGDGRADVHVLRPASGSSCLPLTDCSSSWKKQDTQALCSYTLTEALFSSPVPTEGLLMLTDEEKNTLATEGYPIPTKLPLGKAEEKYLKKIRRKIKNKISAQESRRKKKEYMDQLEVKMHKYYQENTELLKKVEHLENNNRLLLVQLQKISKTFPRSATSAGGTSLMVLVLFFAAFLGSRSPISWSIGYGRMPAVPLIGASDKPSLAPGGDGRVGIQMPCAAPIGPDVQLPAVDFYSRSRLLMATKDEEDAMDDETCDVSNSFIFGPKVPGSYMNTLASWLSSVTRLTPGNQDSASSSEDAQSEEEEVADAGFSVRQVLPLTQQLGIKEAQDSVTSNHTFGNFLSPSLPLLPVLHNNKSEGYRMTP